MSTLLWGLLGAIAWIAAGFVIAFGVGRLARAQQDRATRPAPAMDPQQRHWMEMARSHDRIAADFRRVGEERLAANEDAFAALFRDLAYGRDDDLSAQAVQADESDIEALAAMFAADIAELKRTERDQS